MERVNETTKDCFEAVIRLREADVASLPPPEVLHHQMRREVDEMLRRAAVLGFSHQDAQDMAYALVALIDEVVLTKPEPHQQFWMSNLLQLHYFRENVAGDGFFTRLHSVRKDTHRAEVLQVYFLCMLFGFQGRYRVRGGELELITLIDAVQKDLERAKPFDFDVLAPHGERPAEDDRAAKRHLPVTYIAAGALALALVLYGGLQFSLSQITSNVVLGIAQKRAPTGLSPAPSAQEKLP